MIVVDTSVAYKWFAESEDGYERAMLLLDNHLKKKNPIITLDLLEYELINAWATKTSLKSDAIHENIDLLETYSISYSHLTPKQLREVVALCKEYKVSGYDASYVIFAKSQKCDLITADEKFVKKVNLPFVKLLGH